MLSYGTATTRVFLGYDRFVSSHFAFGIRAGYVCSRRVALPIGSARWMQQNPDSQTLEIWTTRGPWFAGVGLGVRKNLLSHDPVGEAQYAHPTQLLDARSTGQKKPRRTDLHDH
jgi:hypothetical protein